MNLDQLRSIFGEHSVTRIFAKRLAANDNSKNQVYVGGSMSVLNLIPPITVTAHDGGKKGPGFKAPVNFNWVDTEGHVHNAPGAQLILYPNYPEVRLSGFLQRCRNAPSEVMACRDPGRVLVFGVNNGGKVLAYADTAESPIGKAVHSFDYEPDEGVFFSIPTAGAHRDINSRDLLLGALRRIHLARWIESKRLKSDGSTVPCKAQNCGGYTLEAELGICANGYSEPDFHGWEVKSQSIKQFGVRATNSVTLMTPEPKRGFYASDGAEAFVRRYGYQDKRGRADRLNFGGVHKAGVRHETTGLTFQVDGYDAESGKILKSDGGLNLVDDNGNIAAGWGFDVILSHWKRKHAKAVYVPCLKKSNGCQYYYYAADVHLGIKTDFNLFLLAFIDGAVFYDPGIKIESASSANPKLKRRSQFRIKSSQLPRLYESWEEVSLLA